MDEFSGPAPEHVCGLPANEGSFAAFEDRAGRGVRVDQPPVKAQHDDTFGHDVDHRVTRKRQEPDENVEQPEVEKAHPDGGGADRKPHGRQIDPSRTCSGDIDDVSRPWGEDRRGEPGRLASVRA